MKKLLYSSAVLIASCGMAAAQVSVGGDASVGIKYDGKDTSIHHNVDLELALSGQTDGGLSFGAEMTITNAPGVDLTHDTHTPGGTKVTTITITDMDSYKNMYTIGDGILHRDGNGKPLYLDQGESGTTFYHANHYLPTMPTGGSSTVTGKQYSMVTDGTVADTEADDAMHKRVVIEHEGDGLQVIVRKIKIGEEDVFVTEGATSTAYKLRGGVLVATDSTGDGAIAAATEADGPAEINDATITAVKALSGFDADEGDDREKALIQAHLNAVAAMSMSEATIDTTQDHTIIVTDMTNADTRVSAASVKNDASVFISGGFGKISVGAVDAGDMMAVGMADVGYDGIGVDNVAETGFRGASTAEFLYEFSAGGVSFGLSSQADGETSALGIKYSLDPISVGIGYTNLGNGNNVLGLGIGASLGGVSTNIMYAKKKTGGSSAGMDASFAAADNMTVTIAAASNNDGMGMKESAYGLGLSFDLGGGATLGTGVGTVDGETKADLGLNLTF